MSSLNFEQLEAQLKTLGENKGVLSISKKQAIRDRIFKSIGQIELADAIATGETKASLVVSLKHLKQALIPHRLSFSMPATVAVVIMVFMGSIVTGAVAQSSKPGDTLFIMKKVLENLEMAVVTNPFKKAELSLNIADQRLKYLGQSVGTEEALHIVLKESQTALVSARATIQKAKDSGDEAGATELLEKFNALLADQKNILEDIEKTVPSEDIQKTIVAIRDEVEKSTTKDAETTKIVDKNTVVVSPVVAKPIVEPKVDVVYPPSLAISLTGRQTLTGRIGTSGGRPIIFFSGGQYVEIVSAPINFFTYIGTTGITVVGIVTNGQMIVYQVRLNGVIIGETNEPLENSSDTNTPTATRE